MGLTALDIIVLVLVGGGLVFGFIRGFVFEVLTLMAWVAAVVALTYGHEPATRALEGPIGTTAGATVAAFVLVFGVVFVAGKLISKSLGRRVRTSVVGPIDRILGSGFGALKGLIGATLLYLGANFVYDTIWTRAAERPDWMVDSRSYPLLQSSGRVISSFIEARREGTPRAEQARARRASASDQ